MAAKNGHFPGTLPILDGKNFDKWCTQTKPFFGYQDVSEILRRHRRTYKELKKKDCKAQFILHQCVDASNFEKIENTTCSKNAWKILESSYEGAENLKKVRLQTLRSQYESNEELW